MARKTRDITIEKGRDQGKTFRIQEMPVSRADKWANVLLASAARGGVDVRSMDFQKMAEVFNINDSAEDAIKAGRNIDVVGGILELANLSIAAIGNITADVFQASMDELVEACVEVVPSGGKPREMISIDDEIEDLKTLWILRKEAFALHVDFLEQGNS